jgi:hypothetical protein
MTRKGKKPKMKKSKSRLVKFSGLFKHATGLNIGHPNNANIFHAHPWFGKGFGTGIGDYLGAVSLDEDTSLHMELPDKDEGINYEVSVFSYPSWELINGPFVNMNKISIGSHKTNSIMIPHDDGREIVVIVTGWLPSLGEKQTCVDEWMRESKSWIGAPPVMKDKKEYNIEIRDDDKHIDLVETKYLEFIKRWLPTASEDEYAASYNITSTQMDNESVFPPTKGIVETVNYTPSEEDEILVLVYPNREITLGQKSSLYIETKGKRSYFNHTDDETVGFFVYELDSMDTVYFEERFLISPESKTIPFYVHVFSKL